MNGWPEPPTVPNEPTGCAGHDRRDGDGVTSAEERPRGFFDKRFWGVELVLLFLMGLSVAWLCSSTSMRLFRDGEHADVRVVTDLGSHAYEVVYEDGIFVVDTCAGIEVGGTLAVLVDPDDPNGMVASYDVKVTLGFVAVGVLAPFAFPGGRLLYFRHLLRARARPGAVLAGSPESQARDPQPEPSR